MLAPCFLSISDGTNYQVLHSFSGSDGNNLAAELTVVGSVLYGTTRYGGTANDGVLFSMNLDGSNFQVVRSFTGGISDGANPAGGLTFSGSVLYGATLAGGSNAEGIVYSINTDGSNFQILHDFTGATTDGGYPGAGLTIAGSVLYGTTSNGGVNNVGTVFSLNTSGSNFHLLVSVGHTSAEYPSSDLTLVGSTLYGATTSNSSGGNGTGTLFSVSTNGSNFSALDSFASQVRSSSLLLVGSSLFGTTVNGGTLNNGSIFSVNLDGSNLEFFHSFLYSGEGRFPQSGLTLVGSALFGTTEQGGPDNDGTVFSMNLDGSNYQVLHTFTGNDGANPVADLTLVGSVLYGTTEYGGTANKGAVFSMNLDGSSFQLVHSFTGGTSDGANPLAGLTLGGSVLYGTTNDGGAGNEGTVFSMNTDGSDFEVLYSEQSDAYFAAPLTLVGSTLYGTMLGGGIYLEGAVFSVNTDGSDFHVLDSFPDNGSGLLPSSALTLIGSTLYGTTGGGSNPTLESLAGPGVLYSLNLDGSNFQILHYFLRGQGNGTSPVGALTTIGSTLYGNMGGGNGGGGAVFSINADGSDYQILHTFHGGSGGGAPYAGLALVGSSLYGTTNFGGQNGLGTVFSLNIPAPQVVGVQVCSTSWTSSYLSALQQDGLGNGSGYAIPVGTAAQLQDLPWVNLNQVQIAFSQNVNVQESSLLLTRQNDGQYGFSGFNYNPTTFVATWTLANPIPADRLQLDLQSTGLNAETNSLGTALDGAWTNGSSVYPSGNGTTSDFNFAFNVLPGDLNQDGIVNAQEIGLVASHWLQTGNVTADAYGKGIVNAQDIAAITSHWLETLPTGGDGGAGAGEVADTASNSMTPSGTSLAFLFIESDAGGSGLKISKPQAIDQIAAFLGVGQLMPKAASADALSQRAGIAHAAGRPQWKSDSFGKGSNRPSGANLLTLESSFIDNDLLDTLATGTANSALLPPRRKIV